MNTELKSIQPYHEVCAINPALPYILDALHLKPTDIPRLRDGYCTTNFTAITLFVKVGGKERANHKNLIEFLWNHPQYVSDKDWSINPEYAEFSFRLSEKQQDKVDSLLASMGGQNGAIAQEISKTATQKWEEYLDVSTPIFNTGKDEDNVASWA